MAKMRTSNTENTATAVPSSTSTRTPQPTATVDDMSTGKSVGVGIGYAVLVLLLLAAVAYAVYLRLRLKYPTLVRKFHLRAGEEDKDERDGVSPAEQRDRSGSSPRVSLGIHPAASQARMSPPQGTVPNPYPDVRDQQKTANLPIQQPRKPGTNMNQNRLVPQTDDDSPVYEYVDMTQYASANVNSSPGYANIPPAVVVSRPGVALPQRQTRPYAQTEAEPIYLNVYEGQGSVNNKPPVYENLPSSRVMFQNIFSTLGKLNPRK